MINVYPVMIKNLLKIVLFNTLFAKEGPDTYWYSSASC